MEITKILDMENDGLRLAVNDGFLYILNNRTIYKYNLTDMSKSAQNTILKKDGKARDFVIGDKYVFLYDFCDLYILNKTDLQIIDVIKIGTDLSSDINRLRFCSPKLYLCIRNGVMAVMDTNTMNLSRFDISDSSFWGCCVTDNRVYTGTVKGELIEIEKESLEVVRKIQLCKKNIYSVIYEDGLLYTTSQDQTIKIVDVASFETVCVAKKAVTGMVNIVGIYKDNLIIAGERNPLSFWDKKTLHFRKSIDFPQNRSSIISGNNLFGGCRKSVYKIVLG